MLRLKDEAAWAVYTAERGSRFSNGPAPVSGNAPAATPPCRERAGPPLQRLKADALPVMEESRSSRSIKRDAASKPPKDPYRLVSLCQAEGLPVPIPEYAFAAPARKWRADYCWPHQLVIVEIDGAIWSQGRHTRGSGFIKDMEKLNAAALLGFRVLRYGPKQMGECLRDLRRMFA